MPLRKLIVTGASSGIGRAVVERLLDAGLAVVGVARDFDKFPCAHPRFEAVRVDLGAIDELPGRLDALVREHGDSSGAVLAAGTGLFKDLEQCSVASIRAHLDLNLLAPICVARALLPGLKRRGGGDLVFIGSEAALRGRRRGSIYCAAKFAVRGFAQALREECAAAGVRICQIHPGMVRTPFFDGLEFEPGAAPENALAAADVAAAVLQAITAPSPAVYEEISIAPLKRVVRFRGGES